MKKKILVAPLNWGIGHATRCVPVINQLVKQGFEPVIASDGDALRYLEKEFPKLNAYKLPAYDIKYSNNSYFFKFNLLVQIPKINKAVADEFKVVQQLIIDENIKGIISDNRFGVQSKNIPSIYITHQINVLSGITTFFTSKVHQKIIKKFDQVWVPDTKDKFNLSGNLSTNINPKIKPTYIGFLSRFKNQVIQKDNYKYDFLVLLSGTEPQRTILEKKLIAQLENSIKKVLFVRGKIDLKTTFKNTKNITFINFLTQKDLQKSIIESNIVIARSGYSTMMDLAVLQKICFFIPTPNQTEQEYLAKHLDTWKIAPFSTQKKFKIAMLDKVKHYKGFKNRNINKKLDFSVFK